MSSTGRMGTNNPLFSNIPTHWVGMFEKSEVLVEVVGRKFFLQKLSSILIPNK